MFVLLYSRLKTIANSYDRKMNARGLEIAAASSYMR